MSKSAKILHRMTLEPGFHNTEWMDCGSGRALKKSVIQLYYFKLEKTKPLEGALGYWAHTAMAAAPPRTMDPR